MLGRGRLCASTALRLAHEQCRLLASSKGRPTLPSRRNLTTTLAHSHGSGGGSAECSGAKEGASSSRGMTELDCVVQEMIRVASERVPFVFPEDAVKLHSAGECACVSLLRARSRAFFPSFFTSHTDRCQGQDINHVFAAVIAICFISMCVHWLEYREQFLSL